jgi:hypothetical protein
MSAPVKGPGGALNCVMGNGTLSSGGDSARKPLGWSGRLMEKLNAPSALTNLANFARGTDSIILGVKPRPQYRWANLEPAADLDGSGRGALESTIAR